MQPGFVMACALAILFGLTLAPLHAASGPQRIWVMAIGVSQCTQPGCQAPLASQSAKRVAEAFTEAWPERTTVLVLTNDGAEPNSTASWRTIDDTLKALGGKITSNDRLVVYCNMPVQERAGWLYLLPSDFAPVDGKANDFNAVVLSALRQRLETINCKERLLILDLALTEPLTRSSFDDGAKWRKPASATLWACSVGERAYVTDARSFVTEALIEGLRGKGTIDALTRTMTLQTLVGEIADRVPGVVHEALGATAVQHPVLAPEITDPVVIRPSRAIAVADFSGEAGKALADQVQAYLTAAGVLALEQRDRVTAMQDALKLTSALTPAEAQKLARVLNTPYVLLGTVKRDAEGKLLVTARVLEAETLREVAVVKEPVVLSAPDKQVDLLADNLLSQCWRAGLCARVTGALRITIPGAAVIPSAVVTVVYAGEKEPAVQDAPAPLVGNLRPGSVVIIVNGKDCYPGSEVAMIAPGKETSVMVALRRRLGGLNVAVMPASAKARILIGGESRGIARESIMNLPVGKLTFTVSAPGYLDTTRETTIISETETREEVTLQPRLGTITLTSTPPGAAVYFGDGNIAVGVTPLALTDQPAGPATMSLKLDGYYEKVVQALVPPGDTAVCAVTLEAREALTITTVPPGGAIFINGERQPNPATQSLKLYLQPGTFEIKGMLEGCAGGAQTVILGKNEVKAITLDLQPLAARVRIATDPPGATVYVDEKKQEGTTPLTLTLPEGAYRLTATLADYDDCTLERTFRRGGEEQVALMLKPRPARVMVVTAPADGITLHLIDNTPRETPKVGPLYHTPLPEPLLLPPGEYLLVASGKGFQPQVLPLSVQANQTIALRLDLLPLPAELLVITEPKGANVSVSTGTTPGGMPTNPDVSPCRFVLPAGSYFVHAALPGYQDQHQAITLVSGGKETLALTLTARAAQLRVATIPPGARVLLGEDSTTAGSTPCTLTLPPGTTTVTLQRPGFQPQTRQATLPRGETQTMQVALAPDPNTAAVTFTSDVDLAVTITTANGHSETTTVGQAGVTLGGLAPGKAKVTFQTQNGKPATLNCTLERGKWLTLPLSAPGKRGMLTVLLDPTGVTVTLDGRPCQTTVVMENGRPVGVQVKNVFAGSRTLVVTSPRCLPWTGTVEVKGRDTRCAVTLAPRPGTLVITSLPAGATVALDGIPAGVTPLTLEQLTAGRHTLELTKAGYLAWRQTLELPPAEAKGIVATLEPATE